MIKIHYYDEVFIRIESDDSTLADLRDWFTFTVEGHRFMPKFRAGLWDGKIVLLSYQGLLYKGLLDYVIEYADRVGEKVSLDSQFQPDEQLTYQDILSYAKSLDMKFEPREHQIQAILHAFNKQRSVLVSPTSCMAPETEIDVILDEKAKEILNEMSVLPSNNRTK